jgi:coenzyme F420-reducing hydrogenase alpha subunit
VLLRKYGQEVIRHTAGKRIHGTGSVPGGVNKSLTAAERDELQKDIYQMIAWSRDAVRLVKRLFEQDLETYRSFGTFEARTLSLVRADGAMDLYHGGLRAQQADGSTIFDHVDYGHYWEQISEEVKAWSYMKFPYLRALGHEDGWYRVGPLTRVTRCDFIPTPLADRERREFLAFDDGRAATLDARLPLGADDRDAALGRGHQGPAARRRPARQDLMASGPRQARGVGVIEAPRGTLIHHYRVDENDQVARANLIVSTTHNNHAMNIAIREVAKKYLDGRKITEGLLNHIEVAVRAFDPCLSCATHAIGKMPLEVQLVDAEGTVVRHAGARLEVSESREPAAISPHRSSCSRRQPESRRRRDRARTGRAARGRCAAGRRGHHRVPAAGRERARPRRARAGDLRGCRHRHAGAVRAAARRGGAEFLHTSHALSPEAVLATYRRVTGERPPEAWVLCVRGESFELGESLSDTAAANLEAAWQANCAARSAPRRRSSQNNQPWAPATAPSTVTRAGTAARRRTASP